MTLFYVLYYILYMFVQLSHLCFANCHILISTFHIIHESVWSIKCYTQILHQSATALARQPS
jgi:hypothetical protein